jgi:Leucine-rich repeat (LRR) protein
MADTKYQEVLRRMKEAKTELALTDLGLKTLPEAPGDLTDLRKLDLSGNRLQEIPDFLYGLTVLEELDLGNNRISRLEPALGKLTRLVVLDLSENRLTGLPEEIGALTQLRECHLYSNKLQDLPKSLCRLQSLALLDAARNLLNSLPPFDSRLTNLEYLDLSWNKLQNLPTGLAALTRLRRLDVGYNRLQSLGSELFSLINLEELYLEHNDLSVIPAELAALPRLWALSIKGNPYTDLPAVIEQRAVVSLRQQASKVIDSTISGGPEAGKRYFDKATKKLEIRLSVGGLPDTEKTLDLYYKRYQKRCPVKIKYPDGRELQLGDVSRKKAMRLAREHRQDLETGTALLDFEPTKDEVVLAAERDFSLESTLRLPEVKIQSTQPPSTPPPAQESMPGKGQPVSGEDSEPAPKCYLSLEGQEVNGTQVKCDTAVDVVFGCGEPPPLTTLAKLAGKKLQKAILESADLGITLIPRGFTFRDGSFFKIAKFRQKKLEEPIRFLLQANAKPVPDANLYFCFDRGGIILYEFNLAVAVVMSLDTAPSAAQGLPLNLDLDEVLNEQIEEGKNREATLTIWEDGEQLRVTLIDRESGDVLPQHPGYSLNTLTKTSLAANLPKINAILKDIDDDPLWAQGNPLILPTSDGGPKEEFQACLERVAGAGSSLFEYLSYDPDFASILQHIGKLEPGSRLTIITDCLFLPWEILYPLPYYFDENKIVKTPEPVQPQAFWGYQFEIECLLKEKAGTEFNPSRVKKAHKAGPLILSCNLNPTIDGSYKDKPFKPVAAQEHWMHDYEAKLSRLDLYDTGKEILEALNKKDYDPTLLYLYCHGQSDQPFTDNRDEILEVDIEL